MHNRWTNLLLLLVGIVLLGWTAYLTRQGATPLPPVRPVSPVRAPVRPGVVAAATAAPIAAAVAAATAAPVATVRRVIDANIQDARLQAEVKQLLNSEHHRSRSRSCDRHH